MQDFCNLSFNKFILHLETIIACSLRAVKKFHVSEEKRKDRDGFDESGTRHL